MRNLLALVGAALVTFAAAGYFLGWYEFKAQPDRDGHEQVDVDVNTPKIKHDLDVGRGRIQDIISGHGDQKGTTPQTPSSGPVIVRPVSNNGQSGGVITWGVQD